MITSLYTNNKYNIRLLKQLIYKSIEQAYRTQNCFTVHKVLNPFDCLIDTDISWDIRVIIHNSQLTDTYVILFTILVFSSHSYKKFIKKLVQ